MNMSEDTQQRKKLKILLIGEICRDVYVFGSVDRISPEAPVPVLKKKRKEYREGMAGNVFKNINSISNNTDIMIYSNSIDDIKKIRFIDEKSNYQIMRYDIEKDLNSLKFDSIEKIDYDAIVISDYNKGFLNDKLIKKLFSNFKNSKIFVDTKRKDISIFKNCILKINEKESKEINFQNRETKIIKTMGQKGCTYLEETYPVHKVDVHDVCGAGDVFLAALVVRWLETKDIGSAIKTANNCAALSVTKLGCYSLTREEYENLCI